MKQLPPDRLAELVVASGVLLAGLALGAGAIGISSDAGYGGIGPNFLPWLAAGALSLCGAMMVREALTGGFRERGEVSGAARAWWPGLAWISAGLLLNALLIERAGFVLSCALCYLLAVQGLRRAAAQPDASRALAIDAASGLAIAAPVFWAFTQFLAINLPGLTRSGWI